MPALIFSKFHKQTRLLIALSFLLLSLLGTHWIGFAHSISHSGIHQQVLEESCSDSMPIAGHHASTCHLFDALTLAGFIHSEAGIFLSGNLFKDVQIQSKQFVVSRTRADLYQSRAPPSFIL